MRSGSAVEPRWNQESGNEGATGMKRDNGWNEVCRAGRPRGGRLFAGRGVCGRRSAPGSAAARGGRALAAFLLLGACFGGVADAQRLWSVAEVSARPVEASGRSGAAASAVVVDGLNPRPVQVASVQVEYDYLRLGMGYLELPLANGSVIEAENAVFEDRGDGNLMWTGEVPGAGYESVLFTLQDEHLVGWFGEPGGPKHVVYAGPDGKGTVTVEQGPTGNWCGVETGPKRELARGAARTPDRPAPVVSSSGSDRLDILALYPEETERHWRVIGGTAVGIRQLEDYLNMVFRNGEIPATANLIPVRFDPFWNHPGTQGGHARDASTVTGGLWHWDLRLHPEVAALRERHKPDLVHFLPVTGSDSAAGATGWRTHFEPSVSTGWSTVGGPVVLAHEIGHNLGGHHEPVTFGDRFEEVQAELLESFRPYIFGHTDLTSCATREDWGDLLVCPKTVMSYGQDTWDDPERWAVTEPYYSSVRHKPNGWTIGVAGTSEAERLFHETVPVVVRSGEAPWRGEQIPRRVTAARWTGRDTVRVDWSDDWRSRDDGIVYLALAGGANDRYVWYWDREGLHEDSSPNVKPIVEADGSQVGVEVSGLRPGGDYRLGVATREWPESGEPFRSDVYRLSPPEQVSGAPAAPDRLAADVAGEDRVRLTWRAGGSAAASGFEVWYRRWSGDEPHETWRRYASALPASARSANVSGLAAEEEVGVTQWRQVGNETVQGETARRGRYSFVVVAYNDAAFAASDTFDFEFMPGPFPEATPAGTTPACEPRSSGVVLDGYAVEVCVETPAGERRRAWDYRLEADRSGLLYFFDRDNVEVLVKVLDGCAVNGHRWVFVAPVTTLGFRLSIWEPGPWIENRRKIWYYDSERRPQDELEGGWVFEHDDDVGWRTQFVGNPQGRTARTVSDTTAFPCTTAEIAVAKAEAAAADGGRAAFLRSRGPAGAGLASVERRSAGASTDCEPGGPALTLAGGYKVSLCYETYAGETDRALDWGLDSEQSALLYFFERDNAEVLIKVLDGCGVNGHRWVFVAPVTDLAFNLVVESPDGQRWTHDNRLGRTADAASDISAFACSA